MPEDTPLSDQSISSDAQLVVGGKTTKLYHYVYYILAVLEIVLVFRFFLKLLAANPHNAFATAIYGASYLFVLPFAGLFAPASSLGSVATATHPAFEGSTIIAMIVYAVVAWAVAKYILISTSRSEKKRRGHP